MALLTADGFDHAVVGVAHQHDRTFIVYDRQKIIAHLTATMMHDEAEEYYEHNIVCAYVGESTPAFLEFMPLSKIIEVER